MHRPAPGLECEVLRAIGKSGPAPQGIAVLNADGQVLDWVLMFDDDASVLKFLDRARQRFAEHPDSAKPFATERYQRFPGAKRDDAAAHSVSIPEATGHDDADRCPADSVHPPGAVIANVVGRRGTDDGGLTARIVNQEDYAQDRFVILRAFSSGSRTRSRKPAASACKSRMKWRASGPAALTWGCSMCDR